MLVFQCYHFSKQNLSNQSKIKYLAFFITFCLVVSLAKMVTLTNYIVYQKSAQYRKYIWSRTQFLDPRTLFASLKGSNLKIQFHKENITIIQSCPWNYSKNNSKIELEIVHRIVPKILCQKVLQSIHEIVIWIFPKFSTRLSLIIPWNCSKILQTNWR